MCHPDILHSGPLVLLYPSLWTPRTQACPYPPGKSLLTGATYYEPHCLWGKSKIDKDVGAMTLCPT